MPSSVDSQPTLQEEFVCMGCLGDGQALSQQRGVCARKGDWIHWEHPHDIDAEQRESGHELRDSSCPCVDEDAEAEVSPCSLSFRA